MASQAAKELSPARQSVQPWPGRGLVFLHWFLAAYVIRFNLPLFQIWLFNPGDRLRSFRYYSPLIELSIAVYILCAIGLRASKRWAWWLALCVAVFLSLTNTSLLVSAGVDYELPWSLPPTGVFQALRAAIQLGPEFMPLELFTYVLNLTSLALLLIPPSVPQHFGIVAWIESRNQLVFRGQRAFREMAQRVPLAKLGIILARLTAVAQVLLCLVFFLLFPYGLGRIPAMLAYEMFGVMSAVLLFQRQRFAWILSLIWWLLGPLAPVVRLIYYILAGVFHRFLYG